MISAILVALALTAQPVPCPECPVTPAPKVFKGDFKCKPGLVKAKCGDEIRCVPPAQAKRMEAAQKKAPPSAKVEAPVQHKPKFVLQDAPPPPVLIVPPVVEKKMVGPVPPPPTKPSPWAVTAFGEVGRTLCGCNCPDWRFVGGLRLRHAPSHLGLELEHMVRYGGGGRVMLYPVLGKHLRLNLGAGLHYGRPENPNLKDINRQWNWTAGAGAEVPLTERLDLIADYRWFYPIGDVPGDTWDRSWRQSMAFGGLQLRF